MNELEPMYFGIDLTEPPAKLRAAIEELEQRMFLSDARMELPVVSHFAEGLYARELTLPAGTVATGKVHLFEHLVFITKGDISVLSDSGVKRIKAPATFKSLPGTKRVVFCHDETIFTTVHATDCKTAEEAEAKLVVDSYAKYFEIKEEKKCLT